MLLVGSVDEGVEKLLQPWIGLAACDPGANLGPVSPGTRRQSSAVVPACVP